MPDASTPSVIVRVDTQGHWVDWSYEGETGSLGPYADAEMAEDVRAAKELELVANKGRQIDEV